MSVTETQLGLMLSIALFATGAVALVVRRSILSMLLGLQSVFAASIVALAVFARTSLDLGAEGSVFAIAVGVAMLAELALGLAVARLWVRHFGSTDAEGGSELRW